MAKNFIYSDGGRAAAGLGKPKSDCVARAIAIVTGRPYADVHAELAAINAGTRRSKRRKAHLVGTHDADRGIYTGAKPFKDYMRRLGFVWTPTMAIGQGCKVHLRADELPGRGRLVVSVSKHYVALIDGVIHDTHDPSRGGTRCVYGYWTWSG